jgi:hypothetical protein
MYIHGSDRLPLHLNKGCSECIDESARLSITIRYLSFSQTSSVLLTRGVWSEESGRPGPIGSRKRVRGAGGRFGERFDLANFAEYGGTTARSRAQGRCCFHRRVVFPAACGAAALGAVEQRLLCCFHIGIVAGPDIERRVLDRPGE